MHYEFKPISIKKRYPLRISRELITEDNNIWVQLKTARHTGFGEMAPDSNCDQELSVVCVSLLTDFVRNILPTDSISERWQKACDNNLPPSALAALDIAHWDLHSKELNCPLYRCLGLPARIPACSVTIGINPPEVQSERVPEIVSRTGATILKVKLGSKEGIDFDKESFLAIQNSIEKRYPMRYRVDVNGGWSVSDTLKMMPWLKDRGVELLEQPLPQGAEDELAELFERRSLPIFIDESCHFSCDIPKLAPYVDGIVVKLMKCGGITEALKLVATARAHGLKTMLGCMGESSISISAAASIGGVFDYLDLDSHLNHKPDPAEALEFVNGYLVLSERAGHGSGPSQTGIFNKTL
jgi:L-Ala-D/L-Glu epimerase